MKKRILAVLVLPCILGGCAISHHTKNKSTVTTSQHCKMIEQKLYRSPSFHHRNERLSASEKVMLVKRYQAYGCEEQQKN